MAENPYLDLVVEVAMERFNLNEDTWGMLSFTEGASNFSVGMIDQETEAKIKVTFTRQDIKFEEMKRWTPEKKVYFLKEMQDSGEELPDALFDSFHEAMLQLNVPTSSLEVETSDGEVEEVEEEILPVPKTVGKKKLLKVSV